MAVGSKYRRPDCAYEYVFAFFSELCVRAIFIFYIYLIANLDSVLHQGVMCLHGLGGPVDHASAR